MRHSQKNYCSYRITRFNSSVFLFSILFFYLDSVLDEEFFIDKIFTHGRGEIKRRQKEGRARKGTRASDHIKIEVRSCKGDRIKTHVMFNPLLFFSAFTSGHLVFFSLKCFNFCRYLSRNINTRKFKIQQCSSFFFSFLFFSWCSIVCYLSFEWIFSFCSNDISYVREKFPMNYERRRKYVNVVVYITRKSIAKEKVFIKFTITIFFILSLTLFTLVFKNFTEAWKLFLKKQNMYELRIMTLESF